VFGAGVEVAPHACMTALGERLAGHLELLRLLLDVAGSGEPGPGVPLLVIQIRPIAESGLRCLPTGN